MFQLWCFCLTSLNSWLSFYIYFHMATSHKMLNNYLYIPTQRSLYKYLIIMQLLDVVGLYPPLWCVILLINSSKFHIFQAISSFLRNLLCIWKVLDKTMFNQCYVTVNNCKMCLYCFDFPWVLLIFLLSVRFNYLEIKTHKKSRSLD